MRTTVLVLAALVMTVASVAQGLKGGPAYRTAEIKIDKHRLALEYEAVKDLSPATLQPGLDWSPGKTPMALDIEAPLRSGDHMLPPGRYRVTLGHRTAGVWCLRVENVPITVSAGAPVGGEVDLPVTRGAADGAPPPRLEVKWTLGKPEKGGGTAVTLTFRQGPDAWTIRATTWAATERSTQGWTAHGWPLPADLVAARTKAGLPSPFVTFRHADGQDAKRTRVFNLLVAGDLIAMVAASDGPDAEGKTQTTEKPLYYANGAWKPSKDPGRLIGAPLIDIRGNYGMYLNLTDGSRTISFSVTEPDWGKKKK